MEDFLRFFRKSSTRIFGNNRATQANEQDERGNADPNGAPTYMVTPCRHVSESKWADLWSDVVEPKHSTLTGLVFINPCFARTYYVPTSDFQCGYDHWEEYGSVDNEMLVQMKGGRYEQWMHSMIRADSCFVPLHVCCAALLLERI